MTIQAQAFELPWEPVAKARPRVVTTRAGLRMTYTPAKTRSAEDELRRQLKVLGAIAFDREVPLSVEVVFYVPRPKSAPRRVVHPIRKPDIENFSKLVLDAANGILWGDDAQVVELLAKKAFGPPGLFLRVRRLEAAP